MKRLAQNMEQVNASGSGNLSEEAEQLNLQGVEAGDNGQFVKAKNLFEQAADLGDINAMNNLGYMYENGEGIPKNIKEAFKWYKKAAEGGHVDAMYALADAYSSGIGLEKDDTQYFAWIKKLADIGEIIPMNILGNLYLNGKGVMQNHDLAFQWYEKSANKGNLYAKINLAFMYANGSSLDDINPDIAIDLIKQAIKQAQESDSAEDLENAAQAMADLGLLFKKQKKQWTDEAINGNYYEGRVEAQLRYLYDKYLECVYMASDLGNKEAQEDDKGCFITTAVCDSFGKPDDCYELTTFRNFRDNWLVEQEDGKSLVAEYYKVAPKIVTNINKFTNAKTIYQMIWTKYLDPCLKFIETGKLTECKDMYVSMVQNLKQKYLY